MKNLLLKLGAGLAALAVVATLGVASARAQGPQTPSCGNYELAKDKKVDGTLFAKGTYQLNAFGISCEKVIGKYGLFDQFLSQKSTTPLPKPWKYLAGAVGAPKFSAADRVGFRAQLLSG